jgi:hypothetical protein
MALFARFASALVVSAGVATLALAQAPPATRPAPARPQVAPKQAATAPTAVTRTQNKTQRKSIVHHYPYPYPGYYYNDRTGGFRNPGGLGRYAEYYPPGDRFQSETGTDPVRVASFDRGSGYPSLDQQRAAQQIGIQRESVIMNHIDNYARPYYGGGYGVGFFGGFN